MKDVFNKNGFDFTVINPEEIPKEKRSSRGNCLREIRTEKPVITFVDVNNKLKELNDDLANLQNSLCKNSNIGIDFRRLENFFSGFKSFMKDFNQQRFIHRDGSYDVENDIESALINDEYKKTTYELIGKCFDILDNHVEIKGREKISKLLWQLKEKTERTIPYKIYGFRKSYKEEKWQLIGFAETLEEAYDYLEKDKTSHFKNNDTEYSEEADYKKAVQHMFFEPDDECTLAEYKITGENFIEYFDSRAEGPLLKYAKYVKAEGICHFCKNIFTGHGIDCWPVQLRSSIDFGYKRCCPECEEKKLKPAQKDKELCQSLRRQFLFERPAYTE